MSKCPLIGVRQDVTFHLEEAEMGIRGRMADARRRARPHVRRGGAGKWNLHGRRHILRCASARVERIGLDVTTDGAVP